MGKAAAILMFLAGLLVAMVLLELSGLLAELIALIGLLAVVILVLATIAVAAVAFLSVPFFFVTRKMEVREGSFTLDRLEEKE